MKMKKILIGILSCVLVGQSMSGVNAIEKQAIPTVDDIYGEGVTDEYQERWLTTPDSRLVINSMMDRSLVPQSIINNSETMPLNIGFMHPDKAKEFKDLIQIVDNINNDSNSNHESENKNVYMQEDQILHQITTEQKTWKTNDVSEFSFENNVMKITSNGKKTWAYALTLQKYSVNVTDDTYLSFFVKSKSNGAIEVKFNNEMKYQGNDTEEIKISLKDALGKGNQNFDIQIGISGINNGDYIEVSDIKIVEPKDTTIQTYSNTSDCFEVQTNATLSFDNDQVSVSVGTEKKWAVVRTKEEKMSIDETTTLHFDLISVSDNKWFESKMIIDGEDAPRSVGKDELKIGHNELNIKDAFGVSELKDKNVRFQINVSGNDTSPAQYVFKNVYVTTTKKTSEGSQEVVELKDYITIGKTEKEWQHNSGQDAQFEDNCVILETKSTDKWSVTEMSKDQSLIITKNTTVSLTVDSLSQNGEIELKMTTDGQNEKKILDDIQSAGTYTVNLYDYYGDSILGYHKINLKIGIVGSNQSAKISDISIKAGINDSIDLPYATTYQTSWRPDYLGFKAQYNSGMEISGKDYFYDATTIIREIEKNDKGTLQIAGKLLDNIQVNERSIVSSASDYHMGVGFSKQPVKVTYYKSYSDMLMNKNAQAEPYKNGVFIATFDNVDNDKLYVSYALDTKRVTQDEVQKMVLNPFDSSEKTPAQAKSERTLEINNLFKKIPIPQDIQFEYIDAKGVTNEDIKRSYYTAWCLIYGSIIPENEEKDYPYKSIITGKPAMWADAHEKSIYAAAWETFYGMQMYSFIDSELAWNAFEGQMTLIEDDGTLGGEGLPVNRARTAMILFNNSNYDYGVQELEKTYENIYKNLVFALKNPRWFDSSFSGKDYEKDVDFLAAALIDVPYMIQILDILEDEGIIDASDKKAELTKIKDEEMENFNHWFFKDGQYYLKVDAKSDGTLSNYRKDYTIYATKALYIPELGQDQYDMIMNRFEDEYDENQAFGGLDKVKYEEIAYTIYGLYEHGEYKYANELVEMCIRDTVRAHYFSEEYWPEDQATSNSYYKGGPISKGVKPSLFGACQLIDALWMKNGIHYKTGELTSVNYESTNQIGSVQNFHINAHVYDIENDGEKVNVFEDNELVQSFNFQNKEIGIFTASQSELLALINEFSSYQEDNYTPSSWKQLQIKVEEAQKIYENKDASLQDIQKGQTDLQNAYQDLLENANKAALQDIIDIVEKMDEKEYTSDSYLILQESLEQAKTVLNNVDATQDEVDEAVRQLEKAKEGLVEVQKDALGLLLIETKKVDESKYTAASLKELETAIKNAEAALETTDQKKIDEAYVALKKTYEGLKEKEESTTKPEEPGESQGGTTKPEDPNQGKPDSNKPGNSTKPEVTTGDKTPAKPEVTTGDKTPVQSEVTTGDKTPNKPEEITVEEVTEKDEEKTVTPVEKEESGKQVKTSDEAPIMLFTGVAMLSLLGVLLMRKKKNNKV